MALAHYGLLADPLDVLDEAEGTLRRWAEVAEGAYRDGRDIAAALSEAFAADLDGVSEEHREKLEIMNGVHSNAAGLQRWLAARTQGDAVRPPADGRTEPGGGSGPPPPGDAGPFDVRPGGLEPPNLRIKDPVLHR